MDNEIACVLVDLKNYIDTKSTKNTELIIPTLCENVEIYSKIEDVTCHFTTKSNYLVRFLDHRVTEIPDLYDESDLTIDQFSTDNINVVFEEPQFDWDLYSKENPISVARQFLATSHFNRCHDLIVNFKKGRDIELHEPLLKFFSEDEKKILEANNIRIMTPKDVKKGISSKGNFATSFLKMFNGNIEDTTDDNEFIEVQIQRLGFGDNHTGFAFGFIDGDIGVFEYDGIIKEPESNELKHVSFWKLRSTACYTELVKNFKFFNLCKES
ncbi:hypothetical protein AB6888_10505 [Carnobacterium maltaromaticum]|uniref:hypothetical protein n=1 Tax=Carnobacterium maltaromaticum TaxID=2751 RepID=UPI0039BE15BD